MITVSLVEDNPAMRESFVALLNRAGTVRCVSSYANGEDAVRGIPQDKPDVALVDVHLPGMNGIECVARLKAQDPGLQILMLTLYEREDLIFDAIRAGADGYLLKRMPPGELIDAIRLVNDGGAPMSMPIARKVIEFFRQIGAPAPPTQKLTPREAELLDLLAKGFFYKDIARTLGVTMHTVRAHVHSIYMKLHVKSRAQAVGKLLAATMTPGKASSVKNRREDF